MKNTNKFEQNVNAKNKVSKEDLLKSKKLDEQNLNEVKTHNLDENLNKKNKGYNSLNEGFKL